MKWELVALEPYFNRRNQIKLHTDIDQNKKSKKSKVLPLSARLHHFEFLADKRASSFITKSPADLK